MSSIKINEKYTNIKLLSNLDNVNINYVWLHGYNNEILGDIDIAIGKKQFIGTEKTLVDFCKNNGFKLIQIIQHEYCAKYFILGRINGDSIEYLIPDICSDYVRNGRILIEAEYLLRGREYNGSFYHCNNLIEAEYIFLKRTLKNKWGINHFNDFKNIFSDNKIATVKFLNKYLKVDLSKKLIESIEKDDINSLNGLTDEMRKSILFRTFIKNPFKYFYYQTNNFFRIIKRVLRPTGLFIAVIGTDGSGKSTVINSLINVLSPAFRRTKQFHWKPEMFKKNNSNNIVVTEPHNNPPRNLALSVTKLLIYVVQYLFGYLFEVHPKKIKSTLIIFDRYYYDMIVDQKRFRMNMPKKIIQLFSSVVPKPDIVFYLNTKPSIALQRKNELDITELERQNVEFASLKDLLKKHYYIIDNNGEVDSAINEITMIVFNYLEARVIAG